MAPWLLQRCEEDSSRVLSPDSNRCRSYFWIARTAAARPRQRRDPKPSEPQHSRKLSGSETKVPLDEQRLVVGVGCVSRGGQRRGSTNTASTVAGWHATHHFPSLFDQGEYAQDVGLLRSSAHPACGPGMLSSVPSPRPHLQPQTSPHIWAETENPAHRERDTEGLCEFQASSWTNVRQFNPDESLKLLIPELLTAAGSRLPPQTQTNVPHLKLQPRLQAVCRPCCRQKPLICSNINNLRNHFGLQ